MNGIADVRRLHYLSNVMYVKKSFAKIAGELKNIEIQFCRVRNVASYFTKGTKNVSIAPGAAKRKLGFVNSAIPYFGDNFGNDSL